VVPLHAGSKRRCPVGREFLAADWGRLAGFHLGLGGGGLIYAVTPDGNLLYYRDVFGNGANAADGSTGWDPNSGAAIGFGWSGFRHVLSDGDGVIYAVTEDGCLLWYGDRVMSGLLTLDDGLLNCAALSSPP
jgi:hypothetical protein